MFYWSFCVLLYWSDLIDMCCTSLLVFFCTGLVLEISVVLVYRCYGLLVLCLRYVLYCCTVYGVLELWGGDLLQWFICVLVYTGAPPAVLVGCCICTGLVLY